MEFNYNDLIDNPTPRVPVCICLDTSHSMGGAPIRELNAGLQAFYDAIKQNEIAQFSADVSIITFGSRGDKQVNVIRDFSTLVNDTNAPTLTANGCTPMGEAVNLALDMLEQRKTMYKDNGIDYYQPWIVLMTDGAPYGDKDPSAVGRAQSRASNMVNNGKLVVFPIGIGDQANMSELAKFSPKRPPVKIKGLEFSKFFLWLSSSVSKTSQSNGERVQLDAINSWAEL